MQHNEEFVHPNIIMIHYDRIVTMRNKEILYAFNSIAIQLDRISIKEAYTRLLKSFSVFVGKLFRTFCFKVIIDV